MTIVTSADGTTIGYDHLGGHGPTLVLVGGGLDDGSENLALGEHLAADLAVVTYRRRGRGDSTDRGAGGLEREIDDLAAVIDAVGGRAHVFGASSGGALALQAAAAGLPIDRVAVHEVPYQVQDAMVLAWGAYRRALDAALDADDPDEALRLFMRLAGSSETEIAGAEAAPVWHALRALAPTLRHDAACLGDGRPPALLARVRQPVLLTTGPPAAASGVGLPGDYFLRAADEAAALLPDAQRVTLAVGGHVADPSVLGPLLRDFLID